MAAARKARSRALPFAPLHSSVFTPLCPHLQAREEGADPLHAQMAELREVRTEV